MKIGSNKHRQTAGVWYLPTIPWLELSGAALLEARLQATDALEIAKLDDLIKDHVKVKILPMSGDDYTAERAQAKGLQQKATVKGNQIHFGEDPLTKEFAFACELVAKRVAEVRDLELVEEYTDAEGKPHESRRQVLTGPDLVAAIRKELSAEAMAVIDDLHKAIKETSHLEKGLGEALPS